MSQKIQIEAKQRVEVGKGNTRKICLLEGLVPGVVYGLNKENSNIYLDEKVINLAMKKPEFHSHIIDLVIDGKSEQVVLKDSHIHPDKGYVRHVDFFRVKSDAVVKMSVPLAFLGESTAPGVKAGGIATHLFTSVEIKCLPSLLPENIEVDVAKIKLDGKVHLSELKLPKGVELATKISADNDAAVFVIHGTRSSSSADDSDDASE